MRELLCGFLNIVDGLEVVGQNSLRSSCAFSLLELIIALSVGLILTCLGVFAVKQNLVDTRLSTRVNRLVSIIQLARSEAIKRNEVVTICHSNDGKKCGGSWRDGQIVFVDKAGDGQMDDNRDRILRVDSALPKGDELAWNSNLGMRHFLQFLPSGFTNGQNGSFWYCTGDEDNRLCFMVIVTRSGRVRLTSSPPS